MEKKIINIDELSNYLLNENSVNKNPIKQFQIWFEDAINLTKLPHPEAMILSTADSDGKPSARTLLLKHFDEKGFVFFTNYDSRKGKELLRNPWGAITFYWAELERQVRIRGKVVRTSVKESDDYFTSRPKASQLGALASPQSNVIENRDFLDNNFRKLEEKYIDYSLIPRPNYWGGYRLIHQTIEFWQGRPNRMHDRISYNLLSNGKWRIERLAP